MKKKLLLILLAVVCVSAGCGKKEEPEMHDLIGEVEVEEEPVIEEEEEELVDPHENESQSLLTGEWVSNEEAKKRPMAVMLGNTVDALPQYGISEADVLYQCPVEGGLTRLMGIFSDITQKKYDQSVEKYALSFRLSPNHLKF